MSLLSLVAFGVAKRRIEQQVSATLLAIGKEGVAGVVVSDTVDISRDLVTLAVDLSPADPERCRAVLSTYDLTEPDVSWVVAAGPDGRPVCTSSSRGIPDLTSLPDWFRSARESATMRWDGARRTVTIAVPWRVGFNGHSGVIAAGLSEEWLTKVANSRQKILRAHDSTQLSIVADDGSLVLGRRIIADLARDRTRALVRRATLQTRHDYLVASLPLGGPIASLGWTVILAEPVDLAFASAREVRDAILIWGLIATLLILMTEWLVARGVVRPLAALAEAASRYGSGGSADVPFVERHDEIGVLATAWSGMLQRVSGQTAQILSANRDLTRALSSTRIAEHRVTESEQQYRHVFEAVTEGLVILDQQGTIVAANDAACALFALTRDEVVGMPASRLAMGDDGTEMERMLRELSAGHPLYVETGLTRTDGTTVHVAVRSTLFSAGNHERYLVVIRSLDEEKRLAAQVQQAARIDSLGRLSQTIAHEINNVLMGILPFSEIVKRRSHGDSRLANAAVQIMRGIDRGRRITQEILRFTRAAEPDLRPFAVCPWLRNMETELSAIVGTAVELNLVCASDDLLIEGDAVQLEQIITNMAVNARDAMEGQGRFTVRVEAASQPAKGIFAGVDSTERFVHVRVSDTGSGIPEVVRDRIFDPLFTTKGSAGNGLGLAVVHQIVTQHRGQIEVESSAQGTTFHILLYRGRATVASGADESRIDLGARKVLLVEDEDAVADGLTILLELEGFSVDRVRRGDEVRAAMERFHPDVIILDLGLPDMSGVEVYRQLCAAGAAVPTIFSTGQGDEALLRQLTTGAPVACLAKPYDLDTLLTAMERVLQKAAMTP